MSARDDLAEITDLLDPRHCTRRSGGSLILSVREVATRLSAAGWRPPARIIDTVEELEALPDGSVVLDRQHDVAEKHSGTLLYRETRNMPLEYLAKHYGPFTVLWEPGADDE